jgi:signal transduction histidine kinase
MLRPSVPCNEETRLADLYDYEILDTPAAEDFDKIVHLASRICNAPISLVSLVDAHRQWFKSKLGLNNMETTREVSFCAHAINQDNIFVVPDAIADERFHDNPLVTGDPGIRFYAGVPLISPRGNRLGTLCIIDKVPRNLTDGQKENLAVLGMQVVKLMELHKTNNRLKEITKKDQQRHMELERISQMQQRVISIIAHDIRSPLYSLKSLLQLIPDKQDGISHPAIYLDIGITQLNSTLSLLDNLVEWGRAQMKGEGIEYRPCNLFEMVKEVIKELQIATEIKGISLRNHVEPGIKISTDENMLRFILRNLLTNAIKFTKMGGITVDAVLSEEALLVKVEDTGIGIPASLLTTLFSGQKKTSRKGTQNEAGSGLGLSLVTAFIEKMNGSIRAEGWEGKGTAITFILPVRKEA